MKKKDDSKRIDESFVIASFKNYRSPLLKSKQTIGGEEVTEAVETPTVSTKEEFSIEANKPNAVNKGALPDTAREVSEPIEANEVNSSKRTSTKERRTAFEEYQQRFLQTPKIVNRKPVFISESTRVRLNQIARKLGDDRMSASGLLENIALRHLEAYEEEADHWRKL